MNKKKMMMFEIMSGNSGGGGGGADVSGVTATAGDVDEGKIFVDNTGSQVVGISTYKADYIALRTDIDNLNDTLEPVLLGDGSDTNVYANVSNVTATAEDVAQGKVFVNSSGVQTTGTATSSIPQDILDIIQRPNDLVDFTVPLGVTKIGNKLFYKYSLESITMANSVTEIGSQAFVQCYDLTTVNFSNALTTIGERAFYDCEFLTSLSLPDSLLTIGENAFYYCISLTSLTFPAGLQSIGGSAFDSCEGLTEVTFLGTPTNFGYDIFSYCNRLTTIRVPWSSNQNKGEPWGATNATIVYNYTPS